MIERLMQQVAQASFNVMKGARMRLLPLFLYACNSWLFQKGMDGKCFFIGVKLVRVHLHIVLNLLFNNIVKNMWDQTYGKKKSNYFVKKNNYLASHE